MALLAIETATRQLGVAVIEGEELRSSYQVLADYPHGVELPDAVARVVREARTSLGALDGIVVDIGPGSFTGLRIGLAFAKALAFSRRTPLVGVPSLDVLASGVPWCPSPIMPLLDAKRGNVYTALYRMADGMPAREGDCLLVPVDEALERVQGPRILLGDGCGRYRREIEGRLGATARVLPQEWWLPNAATLARLGHRRMQQGPGDDPATLVPLYLYHRECGVNVSARLPGAPRTVRPSVVTS